MSNLETSLTPLRLPEGVTEEDIAVDWRNGRTIPTVTVICHTYNHEPYITDAIESFLAQRTKFGFEILVHDDASTDGTAQIVERYAKRFPGIIKTILQSENQYSQGRRPPVFTFAEARGQYIALCEGDDYWTDAEKLTKQVALLEERPEVDLCIHPAIANRFDSGDNSILGDHGNTIGVKPVSDPVGGPKHYAPTASYVMRAKAVIEMPDWFFQDPNLPVGDYFIEAIVGRKGLLYTPDIMSVYRLGVPGSHTERHGGRTSAKAFKDYNNHLTSVSRLKDYKEIPAAAIDKKIWRLRNEYAWLFLKKGEFKKFCAVVPKNKGDNSSLRYIGLKVASWSFLPFFLLSKYIQFRSRS